MKQVHFQVTCSGLSSFTQTPILGLFPTPFCYVIHGCSLLRVLFYLLFKFFKKFTFIFQLHYAACGILAHQRGIKPMPPALEAWSLKHWSTREVPERILFLKSLIINCVIWKRKFENLLDAKKSFIL